MQSPRHRHDRARARLMRQIDVLRGRHPTLDRLLNWVAHDRARLIRVPVAILFILGGMLAFLPIFGLWMIPLGLLLLAIDLPPLRGPVSAAAIRLRRRFAGWLRRRRA